MRSVCLTLGLAISVAVAGASFADSPPPFPDFTFKRVKPPSTAAGKRITVQIEPRAVVASPPDSSPQTPDTARPSDPYDWFWEAISTDLADSGAGRLEPALIKVSNPPSGQGISVPPLQTLLQIARTRNADLLINTVGTRVSPALVLAVIAVESGGNADAVSGAGAQGLMQLIPATAERFGVEDALDASQNIRGGVAYLNWLLETFEDDPILALAAYNAGENAVRDHQGVPPYAETRAYVPRVLAAFATARGLCKTPPQLISDGCVFNLGL